MQTIVTSTAWLGGTDAAQEGVWNWSDGEAWVFAAWNAGEPNNFNGHENCLEDYGPETSVPMTWNDIDCATMLPAICER